MTPIRSERDADGDPAPMTDDDRALIAEIARSRDTDTPPARMGALGGFVGMIEHLVALGAMPRPNPHDSIGTVIANARAGCRAWLEAHP